MNYIKGHMHLLQLHWGSTKNMHHLFFVAFNIPPCTGGTTGQPHQTLPLHSFNHQLYWASKNKFQKTLLLPILYTCPCDILVDIPKYMYRLGIIYSTGIQFRKVIIVLKNSRLDGDTHLILVLFTFSPYEPLTWEHHIGGSLQLNIQETPLCMPLLGEF